MVVFSVIFINTKKSITKGRVITIFRIAYLPVVVRGTALQCINANIIDTPEIIKGAHDRFYGSSNFQFAEIGQPLVVTSNHDLKNYKHTRAFDQ